MSYPRPLTSRVALALPSLVDNTSGAAVALRRPHESPVDTDLGTLPKAAGDALTTNCVTAFDPNLLMPQLESCHVRALSLFSGGGGLDLGFHRAGYEHVASFEVLKAAANTISTAHPEWTVLAGEQGDVRTVSWEQYSKKVDVLHGGPPCQPFSAAGWQKGPSDLRDRWPALINAIQTVKPEAFVAENVPALATSKFASYVETTITGPLDKEYHIRVFQLRAEHFGVPQVRRRLFFVGFRSKEKADSFAPPTGVLDVTSALQANSGDGQHRGARWALGLADIGLDDLAPTIRSGLTGAHHTTSVLNSSGSQSKWAALHIWPNGVARDRPSARALPTPEGRHRMCVEEVALLQGFPPDWVFGGAVYMAIGQIGNAVPPPMAYAVATAVRSALSAD